MIWTFIIELHEKHKTIKFDFKISPRKVAFIDTMLNKDEINNNIQTSWHGRPTDQQASLRAKSENPICLRNSISYSQALGLIIIFSTTIEYDKNCAIIH